MKNATQTQTQEAEAISKIQHRLTNFFSPVEIPVLSRHFKKLFRAAAFESDLAQLEGGKDALFSLYHLIELMDPDSQK